MSKEKPGHSVTSGRVPEAVASPFLHSAPIVRPDPNGCPHCGELPTPTKAEELPAAVASILRAARKREFGDDVIAAASASTVKPDYLRLLESGARRPSIVVARAIAVALSMTAAEETLLVAHSAIGRGRDRKRR